MVKVCYFPEFPRAVLWAGDWEAARRGFQFWPQGRNAELPPCFSHVGGVGAYYGEASGWPTCRRVWVRIEVFARE
eukprot:582678-Lingulodinium_polyedra.AAC.1